MKKIYFSLFLILSVFSSCEDKFVSSDYTKIEERYTRTGSSQVSTTIIRQGGKNIYKIYYPSRLSGNFPLVVWGNGTGVEPDQYAKIHNHLASWGFIVIDNYDLSTLSGESIIETMNYMIAENRSSGSIFYQHIDEDNIGAIGHSQGASGILNAHTEYTDGELLKTLVSIALPSQNLLKYHPNRIRTSVFFISGVNDGLISSYHSNKDIYNEVPGNIPAAMGMRKAAGHDSIRDDKMEYGYLTAWMLFQLKSDANAAYAFQGNDAELLSSPNWEHTATKNLP